MTGQPPVNGNASRQSKELLSYLNDLSGSDRGMLTGQHNWIEEPNGNITRLVLPISGGKYPAISSFELGTITGVSDATVLNYRRATVNAAIAYWQAGGIVAFSWHQQFPLTANTWANVWNDSNKTEGYKTQAEFDACITPGTAPYNWLLAEYDKVAVHLKDLRDAGVPVLFRPYHEMNGYWFWWGKKNNYKALWELIYNRLVVYHGLNNLLFVWNSHCPRQSDPYIDDYRRYYPGTVTNGVVGTDGKVDVLTHDIYYNEFLQSHHDNLWAFGGGKPIGLSEVGGLPDMQTMKASQYRYAFSIAWGEPHWTNENTDASRRQYYADDYAITREEINIPAADKRVQVSGNGRFLVASDGSPFFWLGDTAWELLQRLNRAEVETYLKSCADQGFNVVQIVALSHFWDLTVPNAQGDLPLTGADPDKPLTTPGSDPSNGAQYDYWDHADYVIDLAASLGLYVALLPTWGKYIIDNSGSPYYQPYKGIFTNAKAYNFGKWIASRYANRSNIVWVLGGDRAPDTDAKRQLIRQMAQGLADGGGTQIKSFHPMGGKSSSEWFHNDAWLNFNMYQSGHTSQNYPNYNVIVADYGRTPVKPVQDDEPRYENAGINFDSKNGRFTPYDVRQAAYWSVFAGSFGHTYGHGSIWQMCAPGRMADENVTWYDALNAQGRIQMKYVRRLIESRPFLERVPDQSLVTNALTGGDHIRCTRGTSYAMIYARTPFTVNMGKISGSTVTAYWYDPRTGANTLIGDFANTGTRAFTPPSTGVNNDWVLVLDDKSKAYPPPGAGEEPEPGDTTPPTAPGNLRLISKTATSVTFGWSASTDASGINVYDIYKDGVYLAYTQDFANLQYTATGLAPNTTYTFTVKAKDMAQNWGPFSSPLVVTTDADTGVDTTPPTAPGNLTLVSKTANSVTMSWTASTDASGIEVYDIYRNGAYLAYTQDFSNLQYTATGLSPNTSYTFTVKAKDKAQNWGPFSNPLVVTTDADPGKDTTPPTAPGNLTLVSKTTNSVTMSWTASTDASGIEVYDIYRNGVYFGYTQNFNNLQFTATGLSPNTSYTFTVKAKDKAQNWGPFSAPLVVTTDAEPGRDTTPPTAPGNLTLVSKTATSVTMRWTASTDASGIEVYDIYRNGVYFGYTQNFSNLQFTATGLSPNTSYTFTVKAKDKAQNWGPFSNPLVVRTNPR
ncbi:DUF4038 domain-containing protein [Cohnella thailandensis]|uniref:DUF4038 domain-containing protein n=1 Tax=Cohnella thailandensis TaxID=557557 RepID=A0A841SZ62_9BACL|nr:DUF4038 domain-containing protein [Cohnella thailandensis]MBB6635120.1 DUF4038 domain-containing protein [Cohnella thailandensis]MBP1974414.1 chitodextrinase [Cohnella thailandensis]